jgi:ubiquinol-cytochrome c reductase cytochrome c1 subunit
VKIWIAFIFQISSIFTPALALAETNASLHSVALDRNDIASLQRGAKIFMNYCSGCHSLKYMRYNGMAKALGLTTFSGEVNENLLKSNLIFTRATIYDPIQIALPAEDAREWFGKMPPDLSLTAREKGTDWIYTYLKSFYVDPKRPYGANNLLVPDVGMPNILAPLQGEVVASHPANELPQINNSRLMLIEKGEMSQHEFDSALKDLITFLSYVAEPHYKERIHIGIGVLLFLLILALFAYQLKKVYWRKIH